MNSSSSFPHLLYKANELSIWVLATGPVETNAYLIASHETKEAFIIDPADGSFKQFASILSSFELTLSGIILTHSHWDHIVDTALWKKAHPEAWIAIHELDRPNLEKPGSDNLPCWIKITPTQASKMLKDGDSLQIGTSIWSVIHTPGHSFGSVCLFCAEYKLLFSGDTLFKGTYGNISFPTSQPKKMGESLQKLLKLPGETIVFPGHGIATTIKQESSWLQNITR